MLALRVSEFARKGAPVRAELTPDGPRVKEDAAIKQSPSGDNRHRCKNQNQPKTDHRQPSAPHAAVVNARALGIAVALFPAVGSTDASTMPDRLKSGEPRSRRRPGRSIAGAPGPGKESARNRG